MPNLKTDRIAGMARGSTALNVRRLMYQSLILSVHLRDHARRLRTAFDAKHLQGPANALVDRVRGNAELDRDLLGRKMLIDEQQAVELAAAELGDAAGNQGIMVSGGGRSVRSAIVMAVCEITLHQHERPFTAKDEIKQRGPVVTGLNIVI